MKNKLVTENWQGGWLFSPSIDELRNLKIQIFNRTNTSVELEIGLNNPTKEDLKRISDHFLTLSNELE